MSSDSTGRGASRNRAEHPHPVDVHVGARVRARRVALRMSQERLGEALGITFQQVQKYERAANRIGASRLYELSRALEVTVAFFYDEFDPQLLGEAVERGGLSERPRAKFDAANLDRDQLELVQVFQRIDAATRRVLLEFAKSIGRARSPDEEA